MDLVTEKIRKYAQGDRIVFKKHTLLRMHQRHILADDIKTALLCCDLIEEYRDDYPLPSALILGHSRDDKPIHAVVAVDEELETLWVITVYEPTLDRWTEGFRERRNRDEMPPL